MSYVRAFLLFWYDFIVGDDWVIAIGVVVSLFAVDLLARSGVDAWWLLPIAVVIVLALSLRREITRKSRG
jgi:hypothetical protein